ncbi:MAG TPA: polyphosphate:AMP phosphotransferase [Candidatus Hydrogenedentes bacterium]|nr:polyphosphate:AMP phosphotransferase [Candidatus Hydrogenedentota bacterium]
MLNDVDLKVKLDKPAYKKAMDALDLRLAELQRKAREAGIPVLVVFEGWDAAGKGVVLGRLLEALDPRGYKVHHVASPTEDERLHPAPWRFWNRIPARGLMAFFNRSWYHQLLDDLARKKIHGMALTAAYERIRIFERQLADDGMVILKFFLHISKKEQAKRFEKLEKDKVFSWRVGKAERRHHKHFDEYCKAADAMLGETSLQESPWIVVPATDERLSIVKVAEALAEAIEKELAQRAECTRESIEFAPRQTNPLDAVDMSVALPREEYQERLPKLQAELRRLQHLCYVYRRPVIIVYEGWDASGKGGNIKRLLRKLDPRGFEVIPFAAPQGEEKTHHYLWRFWRALPKAGHFALFDRSWYGRVLVERVEGFAKPNEWQRAYSEINEFEQQLAEAGAVIVKFWMHVTKDEQLRRFEDRQNTPHKEWKITDEDWRNREKWDQYWEAVSDMLDRTSTAHAPWTIIEGNDKCYARVKAIETVIDAIKKQVPPLGKKKKVAEDE